MLFPSVKVIPELRIGAGVELALAIVDTFLSTEFEGGRHQRRIDLLNA